jgi:mRNA interferase MazF
MASVPALRCLMANKITTIPQSKLSSRVGQLNDSDLIRLNQAVRVFLGLALSPNPNHPA